MNLSLSKNSFMHITKPPHKLVRYFSFGSRSSRDIQDRNSKGTAGQIFAGKAACGRKLVQHLPVCALPGCHRLCCTSAFIMTGTVHIISEKYRVLLFNLS